MTFLNNFEDTYWQIMDSAIKGLITLIIILPIFFWVNYQFKPSTPYMIAIFFIASLIIGTMVSKIIKVNFGYVLRLKYERLINKMIGESNGELKEN